MGEKICICGHFGFGKESLDGQTIKTKVVSNYYDGLLGEENVYKVDTDPGLRGLWHIAISLWHGAKDCGTVMTLLSDNGLRAIMPILMMYRILFKFRLYHLAIGASLSRYLKQHGVVAFCLKRIDVIYVETQCLQKQLERDGYTNIGILRNCKPINIINRDELRTWGEYPLKLCIFSRIMKEKGIEEAVNAVKSINEKAGEIKYILDIYGQVDGGQKLWFDAMKVSFPEYIKYRGVVPFNQSVSVLKQYFALLFPTRFYVEGIPGTIIDAYAAGLPVVASKWESFGDVVDDGITGFGYDFDNLDQFEAILKDIAECPQKIDDLRINCINKAVDYLPENVMEKVVI